ncbi:hypothetical protein Q7C18_08950 [Nesterenkonia sp. CL21]|uniref:hypothetical protein n=1 Tax=Nesterenkonia sp. CL21 TaxID=3064894 RepID=UPI0028795053|nr:hypothetical protein [Nesterenkonia sp. CL21]MDS2172821.1 hypothetical protein [Nesterenkonia sp. CL21]
MAEQTPEGVSARDAEDQDGQDQHGQQETSNQGQRTQHEAEPSAEAEEKPTLAIYSDPGRTSMHVRRLLEGRTPWGEDHEITHQQLLLPLRSDGTLDLDEVIRWAEEDGSEITIVVTEIPRLQAGLTKSVELDFDSQLAVISMASLGPVAVMHSLRREADRAVEALAHRSLEEARAKGGHGVRLEEGREGQRAYITPKHSLPGRVWMTLGMVANNEPLLSLPRLSGVFAAACATGAFGIFYDSIWDMAISLPGWRLAVISCAGVIFLVLWLISRNRLWDRPSAVGGKRLALMYNTSTVISLLVSVLSLYALLYLGVLVISLVLIEPGYMAESLQVEAAFSNYRDIAWLAASLGTFAGAIGSNFDADSDLRNLTQGTRERQRYPRDEEQQ